MKKKITRNTHASKNKKEFIFLKRKTETKGLGRRDMKPGPGRAMQVS